MVTHDAKAAAIADRILFLDDGRIVKDVASSSAHEIVVAMERSGRDERPGPGGMTQVALKGLAGRKLRAVTAAAIVLGVAMVSGTFILTDTINRAFDSIITQSYQNTDAVITGKVAFTNSDSGTLAPPSSRTCSRRCARCPTSTRRPAP